MEYEFKGRKPSAKQVEAKMRQMLKTNPPFAFINWGENWIEAREYRPGAYFGMGWIKGISGADMVKNIQGFNAPSWKN